MSRTRSTGRRGSSQPRQHQTPPARLPACSCSQPAPAPAPPSPASRPRRLQGSAQPGPARPRQGPHVEEHGRLVGARHQVAAQEDLVAALRAARGAAASGGWLVGGAAGPGCRAAREHGRGPPGSRPPRAPASARWPPRPAPALHPSRRRRGPWAHLAHGRELGVGDGQHAGGALLAGVGGDGHLRGRGRRARAGGSGGWRARRCGRRARVRPPAARAWRRPSTARPRRPALAELPAPLLPAPAAAAAAARPWCCQSHCCARGAPSAPS